MSTSQREAQAVDFPDDKDMCISHEAIQQALYIQGRGALKRGLVACLSILWNRGGLCCTAGSLGGTVSGAVAEVAG
ncbi:hypothetical protein OG423_31175 [Micromonospora zamorensis]|uniref:Uncharacterized protein n=1 Tax=Micromonospora zamorensis TaxID=709883 RepID=A0ABZ1P8Z5_9ACTN|nr:hypothetical protein OG423_31175 [Micromonospora zamorensis]